MATITPPKPRAQAVLSFTLNGQEVEASAPPAERLSKVLREYLGLTGTKVGCDAGDCGACTVLLDGEPVCSCLMAAAQAEGHEITTVEGLAAHEPLLGRLQDSFLRHGAAQWGFCTPGMRVSPPLRWEGTGTPPEGDFMDAMGGSPRRGPVYR